jgi:hypothetical protein
MVEKPLEATNTSSEGETSTPEYQVILIVTSPYRFHFVRKMDV